MELGEVIDALYDREINCEITSFFDAGLTVRLIRARLGDEMNGFVAERQVRNSGEAADFLEEAARDHFARVVLERDVPAHHDTPEVRFPALRRRKWSMTPEQFNKLPLYVRDYVHHLETRADPNGDVRKIFFLRDQNAALIKLVGELKRHVRRLEQKTKRQQKIRERR
jgi:hypothetical protein